MLIRQHRLTKTKEIDFVFRRGKSSYDKLMGVKIIENQLKYNRFNIMVSNKVSKRAVVRNKIKRQLRAIIKQELDLLAIGKDCVIIALPPILEKKYQSIQRSLTKHFHKLNLYGTSVK